MAWIKVFSEIWESWKVPALCGALKISEVQAVGHLVSLWNFTERNSWQKGDLQKWGILGMARAARWEGDPQEFADAMRGAGLLNKDTLVLHDWTEHQAGMIHNRENRKQSQPPTKYQPSTAQVPRTKRDNTAPDKSRVDKSRVDKSREKGEGEADPPTLSQVKEYAEAEHLKADPEKFHFYQASKGWPGLIDWKAAFRYWNKTEFPDKAVPAPSAKTHPLWEDPLKDIDTINAWHDAHLKKGKCSFCGNAIKAPAICGCKEYYEAFEKFKEGK